MTNLDLGPAGAVITSGWNRVVQLTGTRAKTFKRTVGESYIYPPENDAAALYEVAVPVGNPQVFPLATEVRAAAGAMMATVNPPSAWAVMGRL